MIGQLNLFMVHHNVFRTLTGKKYRQTYEGKIRKDHLLCVVVGYRCLRRSKADSGMFPWQGWRIAKDRQAPTYTRSRLSGVFLDLFSPLTAHFSVLVQPGDHDIIFPQATSWDIHIDGSNQQNFGYILLFSKINIELTKPHTEALSM